MAPWSNGKTHPFHGCNTGSIPVGVTTYSPIVQLVERLTVNQEVVGSSPTGRANQDSGETFHLSFLSFSFVLSSLYSPLSFIWE